MRCHPVLVVGRRQTAEKQGNGDHVLDAMVTVRGIIERALLIDDTEAGFMGANGNLPNIIGRFSRSLQAGPATRRRCSLPRSGQASAQPLPWMRLSPGERDRDRPC